jgi:hypothetical protein
MNQNRNFYHLEAGLVASPPVGAALKLGQGQQQAHGEVGLASQTLQCFVNAGSHSGLLEANHVCCCPVGAPMAEEVLAAALFY